VRSSISSGTDALDAEAAVPGAADCGERAGYLPFWIGGEALGRVRQDLRAALLEAGAVEEAEVGLRLRDDGFSGPRRSRLLQGLAVQLRNAGLIADWRNELCSVLNAAGCEVARCERGAFRTLGIQNRAVHVNGYLADGRLWVARRSQLKRADPGMLDNVAAGGVSAGETLRACAVRELWEEAGVPRELATRVDFPGISLRSVRETRFGLHDERVIVADVLLPAGFVPLGRDGEVEHFICLTRAEVEGALARHEFTVEAALSTREFLDRTRDAG
jgi:8-oxo-dGTP pyrophosphatase MutT (NUDIX family)